MEIDILVDNEPDCHNKLENEHGLSMLIKLDSDRRILCDMGASDKFAINAERLGIDLNKIDFAFLSHGHKDHTGGLNFFLNNFSAPVYLSSEIHNHKFYSLRHESPRDISTDNNLFTQFPERLREVSNSVWIDNDIAIVKINKRNEPLPFGNKFLTTEKGQDTFEHELALAIRTDNGIVIISSCSHCGAFNIIEACKEFTGEDKVSAFVGGLHYVDSEYAENEAHYFIQKLKSDYPDTKIYTGHCTGSIAKDILKKGEQIKIFATGITVKI